MLSRVTSELGNPYLVARFQKFCGVELVKEKDTVNGCDPNDRGGEATRSSAPTLRSSGDARRRASNRHSNGNNNTTTTTNNNNNNNINGRSCDNGVLAHKNGFVKESRCSDDSRGAVLNGVGTTNHPTTTCRNSDDGYSSKSEGTPTAAAAWKQCSCCETAGFSAANGCIKQTQAASHDSRKSATRVVIRYPVLYYCAKVGAFLGNEEFYLTGLPLLLWAVDSAVVRQTAVLWWLVMYLGQAAKDYLAWPRPPSPPVVRLETEHLDEFSMPSTHAMAGTAIPLLLATLLLERYQLPVLAVVLVAVVWCTTTCFSRLYLGVHTALDLVCGILSALAVYAGFSPLMARYDLYQQTHLLAPLVLIATSLALCTVCYPSPNKGAARADAITITAVVVGVGIGSWLNYQLGFSEMASSKPQQLPVSAPTLTWLGMAMLQLVVGVAAVFVVKVVVKMVTVRLFSTVFGLDRVDTEHPGVMVGYKYTTYLCLGLTIAFLAPLIFTFLGFGRPGYYQEVL